MSDTVNLMVVGVSGDLSRAEITQKLVEEFGQSPVAFDPLLDAAFGETAPYAAQSDVNYSVAEAGKTQLESFGIVCLISSDAQETLAVVTPTVAASADMASTDALIEEPEVPESVVSDLSEEVLSADPSLDPESSVTDDEDAVDFENDIDTGEPATTASDTIEDAIDKVEADASSEELTFDAEAEEFGEVDFSEEMGDMGLPVDENADVGPSSEKKPKSDVPEALESVSFDDLQADLIDPGPVVKEKKEPVVMDDGGLSLSDDDSAPLTTPKAKSNPDAADDGGISLADESAASATGEAVETAVVQPQAKESDDGLNTVDLAAEDSVANEVASAVVEVASGADASSDLPVDNESAEDLTFDDFDASEEAAPAVITSEAIEEVSGPAVANDLHVDSDPTAEDTAPAADIDTAEKNITPATESIAPAPAPASASAPAPEADRAPAPSQPVAPEQATKQPAVEAPAPSPAAASVEKKKAPAGLVLAGQPARSVVPQITPEDQIENVKVTPSPTVAVVDSSSAAEGKSAAGTGKAEKKSAKGKKSAAKEKAGPKQGKKLKVAAALAGVVALAGGGTFALMNAGSLGTSVDNEHFFVNNVIPANDMELASSQVNFQTAQLPEDRNLEELSTEDLLLNLSLSSNANTIVDLGPYFQDSVARTRSGPRLGAAVPAESDSMVGVKNRVPHPADAYFDQWSSREADLLLFLALLDNLIEKGELDVAQQLSDRAKDKLFAVMSSQRLARAYSDVGKNEDVAKLMASATRDTFAIKASEERVLALSDFALTEQTIGLNEDAIDSFLKASILARNLGKPELKTVGLSSAARYFQRSGRDKEAEQLLAESMRAGEELPRNTAARDLAVRYVAMSEARIGLFNQALDHVKTIVDPFAAVSAYHGIALAIENAGDVDNARKVLNMAYRAGSQIADKDERSKLLSKVVLAGGPE